MRTPERRNDPEIERQRTPTGLVRDRTVDRRQRGREREVVRDVVLLGLLVVVARKLQALTARIDRGVRVNRDREEDRGAQHPVDHVVVSRGRSVRRGGLPVHAARQPPSTSGS